MGGSKLLRVLGIAVKNLKEKPKRRGRSAPGAGAETSGAEAELSWAAIKQRLREDHLEVAWEFYCIIGVTVGFLED